MVRVIIEDTGCGIPDDIVHRLCEPFFTTRQGEGGTGLGLAICRRVISSAGGQLAIVSHVGRGTTFTLEFPVWKERG
jgi:signal transduction histidine kinase